MNIQSLSIVVPTKSCVNNCKFCVSKMHDNLQNYKRSNNDILKRLKYAMINNITSCIITGTGEPLQNKLYLMELCNIFRSLNNPFPNVELQTTGVMLLNNEENINLLNNLNINTISLSVSDLFDDELNMEIINVPEKLKFKLFELISYLKNNDFNIRLNLNMTKSYDDVCVEDIFTFCKKLGADQITFRKLYNNGDNKQSEWIKQNKCGEQTLVDISYYIQNHGKYLYKLPFGGLVYSVNEMSVVIDDDCMNTSNNDALKYIILREDRKLYCRWDDLGSLIF